MGIILFLIDTSASMNQRTFMGTTLLDVAKGAVETFIKLRSRDPASRHDRYMLVTFDEPPFSVKAGWRESHATFISELKAMKASGASTLGASLKEAFDVLNLHRLHTGIDNYGQGRNPFFLEPAIIVVLTDVSRMNIGLQHRITDVLELPMTNTLGGSELTKEPFRWDQRLFSLMLRIPGRHPTIYDRTHTPTYTEIELSVMSEATGGKSYLVTTPKVLAQCLESLVLKVQSGVVINFEKLSKSDPAPVATTASTSAAGHESDEVHVGADGEIELPNGLVDNGRPVTQGKATSLADGDTGGNNVRGDTAASAPAWHSCRKMIYVRPNPKSGVPTGHWPIPESFWPDLNVTSLPCRAAHPTVIFSCVDHRPMVVENLPFDKYELEPSPLTQYLLERKTPTLCWQVFVEKSGPSGGLGYTFGYLKASTTGTCVNLFVMPYNYPQLLPLLEDLVHKHKMKPQRAWRVDFDRYLSTMPAYYTQPLKNALRLLGAPPNIIPDRLQGTLSVQVSNYLKQLKKTAKQDSERIIAATSRRAGEGSSPYPQKEPIKLQSYRNPFDISRSSLLEQLTRMRVNFMRPSLSATARLQDEEERHSVPIAQMGNYQEYLKRFGPLRDVDVSGEGRAQLFGNPFKLDRDRTRVGLDEANEAMVGPAGGVGKRPAPGSPGGSSPKRQRAATPRAQRFANFSPRATTPPPSSVPVTNGMQKPIPLSASATTSSVPAAQPSSSMDSRLQASAGKPLVIASELAPVTQGSNADVRNTNSNHVMASPSDTLPSRTSESPSQSISSSNASSVKESHSAVKSSSPAEDTKNSSQRPAPPLQLQQENNRLKGLILKEVRKPGKKHDALFQHLDSVRGNVEQRCALAGDVIREAAKYKRKFLIELLNQWVAKQQTTGSAAS